MIEKAEKTEAGEITRLTIEEHARHFFRDPDFKAGYMVITLSSQDEAILNKTKDELEPQLVTLFNELEKLKLENVGQQANIQYIRPNPVWDVQPNVRAFYVGISKTVGEKEWLSIKLGDVITNYKLKLRDRMEKKDLEIQKVVNGITVAVKSGKEILKAKKAQGATAGKEEKEE